MAGTCGGVGERRTRLRRVAAVGVLGGCLLLSGTAGCAVSAGRPGLVDLRLSEPLRTDYPQTTWRFRLTSEPAEARRCILPLCPEYDLVVIRNEQQWRSFRDELGLVSVEEHPDFERGLVAGIAGRIGEPLDGRWPVSLACLRRKGGLGSLTVSVRSGVYHQTLSAPYCEIAYFPGLRDVALVQVDQRLFYVN